MGVGIDNDDDAVFFGLCLAQETYATSSRRLTLALPFFFLLIARYVQVLKSMASFSPSLALWTGFPVPLVDVSDVGVACTSEMNYSFNVFD